MIKMKNNYKYYIIIEISKHMLCGHKSNDD